MLLLLIPGLIVEVQGCLTPREREFWGSSCVPLPTAAKLAPLPQVDGWAGALSDLPWSVCPRYCFKELRISRLCVTRGFSSGDKLGTPCMQVGVRKAFWTAGAEFKSTILFTWWSYGQHAHNARPANSSSSNHASLRMSCSRLASRSKTSKRVRPCLSAGRRDWCVYLL